MRVLSVQTHSCENENIFPGINTNNEEKNARIGLSGKIFFDDVIRAIG